MPPYGPRPSYTAYKRKRSLSGTRSTASSVAKKALREVRKLANTREVKRLDLSLSNGDMLGVSLNGFITNIAPIARGVGDSDRVGDRVQLGRFVANCTMNLVTAGNFAYRWVLVHDKQARASYTPAVAEIFTSARTNAQIQPDLRYRFTILHDKSIDVNNNYSGQDTRASHRFVVDLNHSQYYNGSASTDFQSGNVYLILMSEMGSTTQYTSLVGGEGFFGYYISTEYTDA